MEAANTNLRFERCPVEFSDTDFPFRSLAERAHPKLAAVTSQLEPDFGLFNAYLGLGLESQCGAEEEAVKET